MIQINYQYNGNNIFIIVLVTFVISFLLIPIIKKIAFHVNAVDYPNERKVHTNPTPRLGGLAIFLAFLAGYMIFAQEVTEMLGILIGGFIILLLGFVDDINPIKPKYKLIGQILAASIVVYYGEISLQTISAFGIYINFGWLSSIVTIIVIVALTNAINLIDGIDGLSGGISIIYFITITIIAFIMGKNTGLETIICLLMIGSIGGFLFHNFPPAKIFVGDSGAMFIGYMISIVALLGFKNVTLTSLVIPLLILVIPILDTILAILRRFINGKPIGEADKNHIHHQLLKMRFSTRKTVLIIYSISIMFSAISIFYIMGDNRLAIILYIVMMALLLAFVLKTNVLYERNTKEEKKKDKE